MLHTCSKNMMIRSLIAAAVALLFITSGAHALDPSRPANSYLRTRLTTYEGLLSNIVDGIVQSRDGFLWLTLGSGELARFDGKRFMAPRAYSPHWRVAAIAPDGDLWVGQGNDLEDIPASALSEAAPLAGSGLIFGGLLGATFVGIFYRLPRLLLSRLTVQA